MGQAFRQVSLCSPRASLNSCGLLAFPFDALLNIPLYAPHCLLDPVHRLFTSGATQYLDLKSYNYEKVATKVVTLSGRSGQPYRKGARASILATRWQSSVTEVLKISSTTAVLSGQHLLRSKLTTS